MQENSINKPLFKLIKTERELLNLSELFKSYRADPIRMYGDYLFREYVKDKSDFKFWLESDGSHCLMCKKIKRDCPDDIYGCDHCMEYERKMFELTEKFDKQAERDFHKLSQVEKDRIVQLDKENKL